MNDENILIWLPSPMGDAILSTPALRAIREKMDSACITFFANETVRQVLSPCPFNNQWMPQQNSNPFYIAKQLKSGIFTRAILLKNSFASALSVFLAGIPSRIGYSREARGFLLTEPLKPPRTSKGKFLPKSMVDYYLEIAAMLGCELENRELELFVESTDKKDLQNKFPELFAKRDPIVILVPGGAFGPSKCWPGERFAQVADRLIDNYNAQIVISVSSAPEEKQIAADICNNSRHKLLNLAEKPITLGQLKALFSRAELVITNDTGPRHIAIALGRKVITLFGPNDPAWTHTGYKDEIRIAGRAPCAPCTRKVCKKSQHYCMLSITADMVCSSAEQMLTASANCRNK